MALGGHRRRVTARRLVGDDIDPVLRPVLLAIGANFLAQAAFFAFVALWAIDALGAAPEQVGLALGASGASAVIGALVGGRASDRVGRRPVIVAAALLQLAGASVLLAPSPPVAAAYAAACVVAFAQPLRGATQRALLVDLSPPERVEQAFGAFRVVQNVGFAVGPIAAAGLVAVSWRAFGVGIWALFACSLWAALRLPRTRRPNGEATQHMGLGVVLRDRPFLAAATAAVGAYFVVSAFVTLLPVALTQTHGLSPALWGPLFALNPVLVVFLQLRITRWSRRIPLAPKLALAMLLAGLPFLVLSVSAALPVVAAIVAVSVVGEMLWAPASEVIVSRLAPPGALGLYVGVATAAAWVGNALAPAVGLNVRASRGDTAMWALVAGVAVAAALLYWHAARAHEEAVAEPALVKS
jgi:predicted MFS family arabinose efflux permease